MHKLNRYANFSVNEKMGVPSAVGPVADVATKSMLAKLDKAIKDYKFDPRSGTFNADVVVSGEDLAGTQEQFPIGSINFNIKLSAVPIEELGVSGAFNNASFKIKDGLSNFDIMVNIEMPIDEFFGVLGSKGLPAGAQYRFIEREAKSTVTHELTHAYESYKRATSKSPSRITDTKDFIYDFVSNAIRKQANYPEPIAQFLYLIYGSASYEVNARVPQMWSLLRGVSDPHKRMDIIKRSSIWKLADALENFDADKYYNSLLRLVRNDDDKPAPPDEAALTINKIFKDIDSEYINGNDALSSDVAKHFGLSKEDAAKVSVHMQNHQKEYKKVAKMDAIPFLKFWQKRFNKIGHDFKNRLGKLTTYEEDK